MKVINEIIAKAITDEEFRHKFLNDPAKATECFDLTEEDKAQLMHIDFSDIYNLDIELEERLSKSFLNLPDPPWKPPSHANGLHSDVFHNNHNSFW